MSFREETYFFLHSVEQEMKSPRDEVTCPRPHNLYICPRVLDIKAFPAGLQSSPVELLTSPRERLCVLQLR